MPALYNAAQVGKLYVPDAQAAITAGQAANLPPARDDRQRIALLLVDAQVDFIHEDGALAVPGAVADTRRTIEWLHHNVHRVTTIAASLDSHTPIQIFYPTWWVNDRGEHPAPFTPISADEVRSGRWQPVFEAAWSREYVNKLEAQAKKVLMIWPYHTMIGTPGQALTPALYEAIVYHSAARQAQPIFLSKGNIDKTEHYSILEPEVKVPDQPLGGLNTDFLGILAEHDLIYVAGQAKSHCVLETVTSLARYFASDPDKLTRMRFLIDCTSSVQHPEIDFDAMAEAELKRFEAQGMRMVRSTEPIG
jgi:nicotinamidase-related amidase